MPDSSEPTDETRSGSTADSSQLIQEPEKLVWRAVAAGLAVKWLGAGQCPLFQREDGVDVHLRGFNKDKAEDAQARAVRTQRARCRLRRSDGAWCEAADRGDRNRIGSATVS